MESPSGRNSCHEPEVGILLDLGSPFNAAVQAKDNGSNTQTAEEASGVAIENSASSPVTNSGDMQSSGEDHLHTTEIMTERCSQDTQNSNGSTPWTYLADEHLIDREKFDFDLPVSPVESEKVEVDDEDEVFFGPVGFTEACIAKKTQLHSQSPNECKPMSPLNVEQYLELFLEANKVAMELTKEKKRDASQGSDDQGCTGKETGAVDDFSKKTEESTVGGVVADSQKQSEQSTGAKPSTEVSDCHIERVAVANLPGKTDVRNFKRLVRKDMRSPRRGTYTISVSPANTPPPPHLPSADDCVSKLARDKPQTLTFTAAQSNKQLSLKAPKSKLPVKGTQRSKLPLKGGLKKLVPPPNPSSGTSTDKLLRKKLSSPPKRKRLNSCESEDLISEASSSLASETSDTPSLSLGLPKGKRPQPGSFHTKGTTGPHPPTKAATSSSTVASSQHKSTDKAAAVNSVKAPAAKPRLLQQGPLQRRVVQASRQLKPVKPGQRGFLQSANRPQPVKAVVGLVKVPSANKDASEATPKKAGNLRQTPSRKLCTPTVSTPVHQDKKVVPKRLLTNEQSASKPAARSLSTSTMPTPQSKLMPPSTPSRSDSKVVPASASSMWRRSGIPTPSRRSIASSSRLSSTSSTISNPSPVQFRALRTSTTTSSPSGSPPPPKPAPPTAKEAIIKLDLDSSPACTKEVTLCDGRAPLETKTNLQEGKTNSPVVGLLVDIIPDPEEKLSKDAVSREGSRLYKENLIDLL